MRSLIFRKNKFYGIILLIAVIYAAYILDVNAITQSDYQGVPSVPCIDQTKPISENYSFKLTITRNNLSYTIPADIGHDPGNCLRTIHTYDSSGNVFVSSNDKRTYTLDDCFRVWHKNMNNFVPNSKIQVYVNGKNVNTGGSTILSPNLNIKVGYISS